MKGSRLYRPIVNMMRQFIVGIEKNEGTKGALVYDVIAAYYLINPEVFKLKPMDIVIETKGEYTFGMTVAEKRIAERINANIEVVVSVDSEQFVSDLIKILKF